MQTQPEPTPAMAGQQLPAEDTSGKKSVLKKVKDKAKKLKTKIKKPKSPGSAGAVDTHDSSSASSSEEQSGSSEPQQQQVGDAGKQDRDMAFSPGLHGNEYGATPDPHVTDGTLGTTGVEKKFGLMDLDEKPDASKLQNEVPSAPGGKSAGVTSYLDSHDPAQSPHVTGGVPVDEGKDSEGRDLLVEPTSSDSKEPAAMDEEKSPAAWYSPASPAEQPSEEDQQQKPLKDRVTEGVAATAAAGAGAVGLRNLADDSEKNEREDTEAPGDKSLLQQARETVLGTPTNTEGENPDQSYESKPPAFTDRATELKNTIADKVGYGADKNSAVEEGSDSTPMQDDPRYTENKPVLDKVKDNAAGAKEAVTSKLGYGEGNEEGTGENKTYTEKAYDAAYGARDAVASKLGYGNTDSTDFTPEGEQKSYLQGAKEAVAAKLGYDNRELPASSTEGAYSDEQNTPANTDARFHPGDEDKALSELITEKMSTGAATVKETLMRPFGSPRSGPPTPVTTPSPASATAVAQDPAHNKVPEAGAGMPSEEKPTGFVEKMTGAVTSLIGSPDSSGKKRSEEMEGKANEDPQAVETH